MISATSPIPAIALSTIGAIGVSSFKGVNYAARLENRVRAPLVLGIISLLLTRTSSVTTPPARLTALMQKPIARVFFVLCLSFLASPDIEDAIFLSLLFLGLIQLLRTKEERAAHPYIF